MVRAALLLAAVCGFASSCGASDVKIAVGIKTCSFYHATRLADQYAGWLKNAPLRVVASDAELADGVPMDLRSDGIVALDEPRETAYVPPWADDFEGDTENIDPFSLPRLTHKVTQLWKALHDRFIDEADFFLVIDDDAFVRLDVLGHLLASADPEKISMFGSPVSSEAFLLPKYIAEGGVSVHCGGGSGVLLSRGALRLLRHAIDMCVSDPHTLLHWYWDEIEVGRCLYRVAGINCTDRFPEQAEVPRVTPAPPDPPTIGELPLLTYARLQVHEAESFWSRRVFISDLDKREGWERLKKFVETSSLQGDWTGLPAAVLHSVKGRRQTDLAKYFRGGTGENVRQGVQNASLWVPHALLQFVW